MAAPTVPTDRRPAAAEAWSLMHRLFIAQRSRFLAVAAELELAPAQLGALKSLDPDAPVPMSKLAGTLGCDNSNVTGLIDRLEARGLVERRSAEHDRRVKMLVVTERGAELRRRLGERMSEAPAELTALSAADQRTLRDIMHRALGE